MIRRTAITLVLALLAGRAANAAVTCSTGQWTMQSAAGTHPSYTQVLFADFNHDNLPDAIGLLSDRAEITLVTATSQTAGPVLTDATVGRNFTSMAVGDFNRDGNPDVIVTDYGLGRLLLFTGAADGTFSKTIISVPFLPRTIATGDFDGDGNPDLAVTSWEDPLLHIFSGDGAGGFTEKAQTTLPSSNVYAMFVGDIDHDGAADVVVSHYLGTTLDVLFGNGDGTFAAPVEVTAGNAPNRAVALADFDGDGDLDLVAGNWTDDTVVTFTNVGGRTFTLSQTFSVKSSTGGVGTPSSIQVADFNGDSVPDIAVALVNQSRFVVFTGKGNGSFNAQQLTYFNSVYVIGTGDYNGDGKADLLGYDLNGSFHVVLNRCGETIVTLTANAPVVSVGQQSAFTASYAPVNAGMPAPSGGVTFRDGTNVLCAVGLISSQASCTATLPAGDHTIGASYSGDLNYAATDKTVSVRVTTDTTTTTISLTSTNLTVGGSTTAKVTVTSSTGDTPTGSVYITSDGGKSTVSAPSSTTWISATMAGTRTATGQYSGDATHPPSTGVVTFNVAKFTPTVAWSGGPPGAWQIGTPMSVTVVVWGTSTPLTGTITLFDGASQIASKTMTGTYTGLTVSLPLGLHYLQAFYGGDSNYNGGQTTITMTRIMPPAPIVLDARGFVSSVKISWSPINSIYYYKVYRRTTPSLNYAYIGSSTTAQYTDTNVSKGVVYFYRVDALNSSGSLIASSGADLAMLASFTIDPLQAGAPIATTDFTDIAARIAIIRTAAGLAPMTVDPPMSMGSVILASQITTMRDALNEALLTFGLLPAQLTDNPIVPGVTPVRAVHIQELREATR